MKQNNSSNMTPELKTDAVEQPQQLEQREIMQFVDDVVTTEHVKPALSEEQDWSKMSHDSKIHEITNILSRPVNISNITWNDSPVLKIVNFPSALFNSSDNLINKLNYFTYFRANLHFRVVFNATPFVLGKYWMYYAPYENFTERVKNGSLMNATGYPGVEIDVASGAPVELLVPFVAPISHFDLIRGHGRYGQLVIQPIVPIASGTASDSVTATLYAWFDDVELSMPANKPVNRSAFDQTSIRDEERVFEAQILLAESNEVEPTGILSSLAQYPMRWAKNFVTKTLNNIGFCKPTEPIRGAKYLNTPAVGFTNYNSNDQSVVLAATDGNMIQPTTDVFGTKEDEMDIKYIASRFNVVHDPIEWSVGTAVDEPLINYPITPGFCREDKDGKIYATQLAFLTSMFKYWRGTIRYRISVAKTAFHTGRLRISYRPNSSDPTDTDKDFLYSWILDLSQSSEITIDIPFIGNRPWLQTFVGSANSGLEDHDLICYGNLNISVLTELRAASTSVAQSVKIVPWIAGGDDIEFAVPDFSGYRPSDVPITIPDEFDERGKKYEAEIFNNTQIGFDESKPLISAPSVSPLAGPKLTIGEAISNLRCLTRRFGPYYRALEAPYRVPNSGFTSFGPFSADALNLGAVSMKELLIDPAYFGNRSNAAVADDYAQLPNHSMLTASILLIPSVPVGKINSMDCPLHYISTLYRFYRGGRRFKIFLGENRYREQENATTYSAPADGTPKHPTGTGNDVLTSMRTKKERSSHPVVVTFGGAVYENGSIIPPSMLAFESSREGPNFEHILWPDLNGCVEFEVPYYSTLPISVLSNTGYDEGAGPLCQRFTVRVGDGLGEEDHNDPYYQYNTGEVGQLATAVTVNHFNNFQVYAAAADDFSFGFLLGAPLLTRVFKY